jgi:hypothetical protein
LQHRGRVQNYVLLDLLLLPILCNSKTRLRKEEGAENHQSNIAVTKALQGVTAGGGWGQGIFQPPCRFVRGESFNVPADLPGCFTHNAMQRQMFKVTAVTQALQVVAAGEAGSKGSFDIPAAPILIPPGPWQEVEGGVLAAKGFKAQGRPASPFTLGSGSCTYQDTPVGSHMRTGVGGWGRGGEGHYVSTYGWVMRIRVFDKTFPRSCVGVIWIVSEGRYSAWEESCSIWSTWQGVQVTRLCFRGSFGVGPLHHFYAGISFHPSSPYLLLPHIL